MSKRYVEISNLQCDECGGFADVVEIETIGGLRGTRFLCNECKEKEEQHD